MDPRHHRQGIAVTTGTSGTRGPSAEAALQAGYSLMTEDGKKGSIASRRSALQACLTAEYD